MVVGLFAVIILVLFYYHDKNVLIGTIYEIAVVETEKTEVTREEIGEQLYQKLQGKMLVFSKIQADIAIEKSYILIQCKATKSKMSLDVHVVMSKTEPETYVRTIRGIKRLEEQLEGNKNESVL